MACGFPSFAALSTFGPPGYPSPTARATLSKASPAASSIVRPMISNFAVILYDHKVGMSAGHDLADKRRLQIRVLDKVRGNMSLDVMHARTSGFFRRIGDGLRSSATPTSSAPTRPWSVGHARSPSTSSRVTFASHQGQPGLPPG